jgi:4-amino-4-deoxychorismate lyase
MHTSPPLLFETIRLQHGIPLHLEYHTARLNHTRHALFGTQDVIDLKTYLQEKSFPFVDSPLAKLRLIYNVEGIVSFDLHPYTPKAIHSLSLMEADIHYLYKYLDRSAIDHLWTKIHSAPPSDLLITTDGILRDTTIANIALHHKGIWYTPNTPLLPGTTRARFLEKGLLHLRDIHRDELKDYDRFALLNAMIGFVEYPMAILH